MVITAQQQRQKKDTSPAPQMQVVKRNSELPESPAVVFVEKKPEHEWTVDEPARLARLHHLLDGYYGAANFLELFHCLPEVFAPIHEIASRVSDAVWELKNTWNDEVTYKDEDFNRLFSSPNPFMNIQQMIYVSVCYYLLTGRQFWSLNRPDTLEATYQNILGWFCLPSQNVFVKTRKVDIYSCTEINDYVEEYQLRDVFTNAQKRIFEPQFIMPLVNFNLRRPYDLNKSFSPLMGAEKAIKNLIPVYEARGVIYIKRGALGFIVSRKQDDSGTVALNPEETKQLHKDYNDTYGISQEKSNIGITGQPIDFIQIGMNIKELQPFDETLADAVAIYATLRVPRHLVPSKDQGTFSNTDSQMKGFYDDVIIPLATMFAESFTIGMGFAEKRKYVCPSYDHIDILQENKKLGAEVDQLTTTTAILQYEKGIITKNERNARVGVNAVPGGDVYSTDEGNGDPMAIKLGVGGLQGLQAILTDTALTPEQKQNALIIVFGFTESDAKKLTEVKTEDNGNSNTNKTGTEEAASATDN